MYFDSIFLYFEEEVLVAGIYEGTFCFIIVQPDICTLSHV